MPIIDLITQMQMQGLTESEIVQKLREQGYNAKEINEAVSQTKIKTAVENNAQNSIIESISHREEMQPSIMAPQPSMQQEQPAEVAEQSMTEYAYQTPQAYQAYPQSYEYYQPQQNISTETITEISEQIVAEKISEIRKNIGNIADFKALMEARISGIDERLKRIEMIIEKFQTTILGKVGNYFQDIRDMKDEMQGMQESFSKVVNPLVDRGRQMQKQESRAQQEPKMQKEVRKEKSKKHPIDNYLSR